jgi:hypothetical protein
VAGRRSIDDGFERKVHACVIGISLAVGDEATTRAPRSANSDPDLLLEAQLERAAATMDRRCVVAYRFRRNVRGVLRSPTYSIYSYQSSGGEKKK